ncbi:MAG: hypothetical protein U0984_02800 [Prosthecobacter sp.]|nr:hypothetical protein [Prosthecobacter sp.]
MATKTTAKKGAAKKSAAVVKKSAPAPKAAGKAKSAPAKKPAAKPVPPKKAAPKPALKPLAKAPAKPVAAKPATKPVPATKPAAKPAPAPVKAAAAVPEPVKKPETILSAPFVSPPPGPLAPRPAPGPHPKAAVVVGPLSLSVQTSQGAAATGNTQPANILVVVTCAGAPVVDLSRDNFTLMEHFEVPGQNVSFSNNITSFRNAGTGAYLLQTKPINATPWRSGHHLGQLLVSSGDDRQGHAAIKIIVR